MLRKFTLILLLLTLLTPAYAAPVSRCLSTNFDAWTLTKQRGFYDEWAGFGFKCYYDSPGVVFPLDAATFCPATLVNPDATWARIKLAIHVEPSRIRCVYLLAGEVD